MKHKGKEKGGGTGGTFSNAHVTVMRRLQPVNQV